MKKEVIILSLILLILILPLASGSDNTWFLKTESVDATIEISSRLTAVPTGDDYNINYVQSTVFFNPEQDWRQNILDSDIQPEAEEVNNSKVFYWDEPDDDEFEFSIRAELHNEYGFRKIFEKISFPLVNLPREIIQYTRSSKNIDSDDEIINQKTLEIIDDENDLYAVTHKISGWIKNNITYSLNTLTAEITQKPSWTLRQGYGVCDELSALFIAMLRSQGIPARFVSGVAYTNWNNMNSWGPHAWTEVYFPGIGWVPFDVTYGQFGYIDASHITLRHSMDSDDPSVRYEWGGRHIQIEADKLDIQTTLDSKGTVLQPKIAIEGEIFKDAAGFGSYNLVRFMLKNKNNYYTPVEVAISESSGISTEGSNKKYVLLKPDQEKTIYWTIRISNDLDKNSEYSFKLRGYTTLNATADVKFTASADNPVLSLDTITSVAEMEDKEYSEYVDFECSPGHHTYYVDEPVQITCILSNKGEKPLKNVKVCFDSCRNMNLDPDETHQLVYDINDTLVRKRDLIFFANNEHISKMSEAEFEIQINPGVEILNLSYPKNVDFNDKYTISFLLKKTSRSDPENMVISITNQMNSKTWEIERLENNRKFILNLEANELRELDNEFIINVSYEDKNGIKNELRKNLTIHLEPTSFAQRITFETTNTILGLEDIGFEVIFLGILVFGIVIHIILKKQKE